MQYANQGCICNEYTSLVDRHCVEPLSTKPELLILMRRALQPIINELTGIVPMTTKELIDSRPQRMRKRYRRGLMLDLKPVHSTLNLFIKFEYANEIKAPRAIQYRATPYTARLAKYVLKFEQLMYKVVKCNNGFPFAAKGLNALERGNLLFDMWTSFKGRCKIYLLDHSKFDSRVNIDLLSLEHACYNAVFKDKFLRFLLKQQLRNKGRSRNGLKYTSIGRRASGDANTACGNCLINYAILRVSFGDDAIILVDGDDSVVFANKPPIYDFKDFGMVTKMQVVDHFQELDFCQSQPVWFDGNWIMCRNPFRALARAIHVRGKLPLDWRNYLMTIGIGEGYCSPGMPILSILAKKFRSYGGRFNSNYMDFRLKSFSVKTPQFCYPTKESRESFSIAFGISAYDQILIEKMIKRMNLE